MEVWRSVRKGNDTQTRKSRRTILPDFVIETFWGHKENQRKWRHEHGSNSEHITYVFGTRYDTVQQAQVVRKTFRSVVPKAKILDS
ncbi:hypothetical protein [Natronoglycomyces albus]|uniref:Uncharacterized protein n=1 Tax=Natronoglycomyces albus TaxID=2811108 RepID=A0A895XTM2_9ACTN|nr:hypothetical protein [Natronoglycomyces albus]QSB06665.1 hypothetical protein JQS30_07155 [Natronoglycomyces albus]